MTKSSTVQNKANVATAKPRSVAGAVFFAAKGTAVPKNASDSLGDDFESVGYLGSEGIVFSFSDESTEEKAFGGDIVSQLVTSRSITAKFTLIEESLAALKMRFGASNVTCDDESGTISVTWDGDDRDEVAAVVELAMTNSRVERICMPCAKVSAIGDITYKTGDVVKCEVTLKLLSDANGEYAKEYIAEIVGA